MNFSVLMSVYNKESPQYLQACLQSLKNQELPANEIVLVEDGPISSELSDVIEIFRGELNIISVKLEFNVGLGAALNQGLKVCQYNLVARMDTDDIAQPERFMKQVKFLKTHADIDLVGSFAQEIDDNGVVGKLRTMPVSHEVIYNNLFTCPFIHPSILFRKSKIVLIGGYDESLRRRQDYDLWFRCAKSGMRFYNIPEPLLLYRFTASTHSRQTSKLMFTQALIGYNGVRLLNQSYLKSLYCFIPLLRSFFPEKVQHTIYKWMKLYDPRQRSHK